MSVETDSEVGRVIADAPAPKAPPRAPGTLKATRSTAQQACRHCGAPLIDVRMQESGFCCAGCSYVFRLVHEHGLAGYYNLKDAVTAPADTTVFQPRDFSWLTKAQHEAECRARSPHPAGSETRSQHARRGAETPPSSYPELMLDIQGISCAGCVWLIERVFQQQPGARFIEANAQLGQVRLRWALGEFSAADFARKLQAFGYLLGPAGTEKGPPESRALLKRVGLCAAFAMNVMLFAFPTYFGMTPSFEYARLFGLLAMVFGTLSFLVGGTYFLGKALAALREGAMHIDLPISIGVLGAYLGSMYGWFTGEEHFVYFDFVSTFILLMLVGRWAQVAAVERNQRRLLRQQPKPNGVRLVGGGEVPPEQLAVGQAFVLSTGQTLPVQSRLNTAEAAFSLASINGEAEPRVFRAGQRVPAGAVLVSRSATEFVAGQTWDESLLAQLLKPAERASARHLLLEKIIRGYLIGIIGVAVAAGVGWWFVTHDALRTGSVITAILVVSCPCAVGLAFPLADEMATVALRRRGVFVRTADLWARIGRVRKLVFDKTGTLTLETPRLQNPEALRSLPPEAQEALRVLVSENPHPISQCLLENLMSLPDTKATLPAHGTEPEEFVGQGVTWISNGKRWSLGRPGWRAQPNSSSGENHADRGVGAEFACDGTALACFHFSDTARPDATAELAALRAHGFATYILSGDRQQKVSSLAHELDLSPAHAVGDLTPHQKAIWLEAHGRDDVLMLGDGANDSLAFDRALCRGTPVIHRGVLEQKADFYYLGQGIGGLRALFDVNGIRRRTQTTVTIFSIAYNALAVGMAVVGHMNPLVAAIMMPLNSLITLALVSGGMRGAFKR